MKNTNISIVLQVLALLFLGIIGYAIFTTSSNWEIVSSELEKAKEELKVSKDSITRTKVQLETTRREFEQMKVQKDLIIHKRDSLILGFRRKNAKDWDELQRIKDSIQKTNEQLAKDQVILDDLFGLNK